MCSFGNDDISKVSRPDTDKCLMGTNFFLNNVKYFKHWRSEIFCWE